MDKSLILSEKPYSCNSSKSAWHFVDALICFYSAPPQNDVRSFSGCIDDPQISTQVIILVLSLTIDFFLKWFEYFHFNVAHFCCVKTVILMTCRRLGETPSVLYGGQWQPFLKNLVVITVLTNQCSTKGTMLIFWPSMKSQKAMNQYLGLGGVVIGFCILVVCHDLIVEDIRTEK